MVARFNPSQGQYVREPLASITKPCPLGLPHSITEFAVTAHDPSGTVSEWPGGNSFSPFLLAWNGSDGGPHGLACVADHVNNDLVSVVQAKLYSLAPGSPSPGLAMQVRYLPPILQLMLLLV